MLENKRVFVVLESNMTVAGTVVDETKEEPYFFFIESPSGLKIVPLHAIQMISVLSDEDDDG